MQAEVNIGLLGHVDHGKTTLTKAITGKWTDTHSQEIKRGITIKVGYADVIIYFCEKCKKHSFKDACSCGGKAKFARKISFLDAPGHETLMTTAIAASSIMDGAFFLIAANEQCPQPQTLEHLMVLSALGVKNIIIVQTKVDLVSKEKALESYKQIKEFVKGSPAENSPIIPVSANYGINVDALADAIQAFVPTSKRDGKAKLRMFISRSFDINRPGTPIPKLNGGVLGGSVVSGSVSVGDSVLLTPGIAKKEGDAPTPLAFKVVSLMEESEKLETAHPGGLMAIGTTLDPNVSKSDNLIGSVISREGEAPDVVSKIRVKYSLLDRKDMDNIPLKQNELIAITVHTATSVGPIVDLGKGVATIMLKKAVAVDKGMKVAMSRRIGQRWRLSGWGDVV